MGQNTFHHQVVRPGSGKLVTVPHGDMIGAGIQIPFDAEIVVVSAVVVLGNEVTVGIQQLAIGVR